MKIKWPSHGRLSSGIQVTLDKLVWQLYNGILASPLYWDQFSNFFLYQLTEFHRVTLFSQGLCFKHNNLLLLFLLLIVNQNRTEHMSHLVLHSWVSRKQTLFGLKWVRALYTTHYIDHDPITFCRNRLHHILTFKLSFQIPFLWKRMEM